MLDHIVINVMRQMDEAVAIFERLGFRLTPRGHHSLGSINHLMVEPRAYLELVGLPDCGPQRREVLQSPLGLSGLVFRTDDADATYKRLTSSGFAPLEPILLERPVHLGGTIHQARFQNVRMTAGEFPAGRVYFCQHLNPELVWREEWLVHENGFCGFSDILIGSAVPDRDAGMYATLMQGRQVASDDELCVETGTFKIRFRKTETAGFEEVTLLFDDLLEIERRAIAADGVNWRKDTVGAGTMEIPSLDVRLVCRQA